MKIIRALACIGIATANLLLLGFWWSCRGCGQGSDGSLAIMNATPSAMAAILATFASVALLICEAMKIEGTRAPMWIRVVLGAEVLLGVFFVVIL